MKDKKEISAPTYLEFVKSAPITASQPALSY